MTAAICKLGLTANAAGGCVILLLGLLTPCLRPDATHLLFIALKLLVQCSVRKGEEFFFFIKLTNFIDPV